MILEPVARVFIQKAASARHDDPGETILDFQTPHSDSEASGFPFSATVSMASKDGVSLATLVMSVPDLTRQDIQAIPDNALIRLDAGYRNGTGPEMRPIFFGFLSRPWPHRKDGKTMWTFAASSAAPVLQRAKLPYTATGALVGAIIEDFCKLLLLPKPILPAECYGRRTVPAGTQTVDGEQQKVFGEVDDPKLLQAVRLGTKEKPYTPTKGFMEEVQDLMKMVEDASGQQISQVPNHDNPYQLLFVNLIKGGPIVKHTIDLDSDIVQDAEPIIDQSSPAGDVIVSTDTPLTPEDMVAQSYVAEFAITQAFDPRIAIGQMTDFSGEAEGRGTYQTMEVIHTLNPMEPWTTQSQGPFLGGDFLRAKPGTAGPEDEVLAS